MRARETTPDDGLRPALSALAKIGARTRSAVPAIGPDVTIDVSTARSMLQALGGGTLRESNAKDILDALGIPTPTRRAAHSVEEAISAARAIGYPVVAKVSSARITHKTDVGGVAIGIADDQEMAEVSVRLLTVANAADASEFPELLVEELVPVGGELIVGARRDPQFGPVVMVGLGGVLTELLSDVSHRLAPLTGADAESMIQELSGRRVLEGYRGGPPAELTELVRTLLALSEFVAATPEISELDINPLVWGADGRGFVALDALIVKA